MPERQRRSIVLSDLEVFQPHLSLKDILRMHGFDVDAPIHIQSSWDGTHEVSQYNPPLEDANDG